MALDHDQKTKSIKLRLSESEFEAIQRQAKNMNLSLNKYVLMRVLDTDPGPDMRCRQIMQNIPAFYNLSDQVDDLTTRSELKEWGAQICRYLK